MKRTLILLPLILASCSVNVGELTGVINVTVKGAPSPTPFAESFAAVSHVSAPVAPVASPAPVVVLDDAVSVDIPGISGGGYHQLSARLHVQNKIDTPLYCLVALEYTKTFGLSKEKSYLSFFLQSQEATYSDVVSSSAAKNVTASVEKISLSPIEVPESPQPLPTPLPFPSPSQTISPTQSPSDGGMSLIAD